VHTLFCSIQRDGGLVGDGAFGCTLNPRGVDIYIDGSGVLILVMVCVSYAASLPHYHLVGGASCWRLLLLLRQHTLRWKEASLMGVHAASTVELQNHPQRS
jgi:hypothetical protein